jgi:hypothetical protein
MLWRKLADLEPDLLEVEAWCRTLDPDAPHIMQQIEERLRPLVGWHRPIPGVEIVPFDGPWLDVHDRKEHDRLTGNRVQLPLPQAFSCLFERNGPISGH